MVDLGLGMASGGLHVRTSSRIRFFAAGAYLTVGGFGSRCVDWATKRCAEWPARARMGKSVFDVSYWVEPFDQYDDTPTEVTSDLELVRP